jgi:hypothetical protein
MKKNKIITKNFELYKKFNMLNFNNQVEIKNIKPYQIKKIISNINRKQNNLEYEKKGNDILLKKINPFNFNIYLKK